MPTPQHLAERLRALAAALAAPDADALAIARQLSALASDLDHAALPARPSGATPALAGDARQWRSRWPD
jgi:hypothetical protein